jgi:predicted transcriptional regulator
MAVTKVPLSPWGRAWPNLKGKDLTKNEKIWIAHLVNEKGRSRTELAKKLHLSRQCISKYATYVRKGVQLYNIGGAPRVIDSPGRAVITSTLSGEKAIQLNTEQAEELYKDQLTATAERRNRAPSQQKTPCTKTLKTLRTSLGHFDYACEETSDARAVACANIRNAVSTVVQFNSAHQLCPHPAQHCNFDATQYSVGDKATKGKAVKSRAHIIGKPQ